MADPDFEVTLLCDGENLIIEPEQMGSLVLKIEATLKMYNKRYHLATQKIITFHKNLPFYTEDNLSYLVSQGFRRILIPSLRQNCVYPGCPQKFHVKDVADRLLVQALLTELSLNKLSKNVVLASSDSDFTITVETLKGMGRRVFIATDYGIKLAYKEAATHQWIFHSMWSRKTHILK